MSALDEEDILDDPQAGAELSTKATLAGAPKDFGQMAPKLAYGPRPNAPAEMPGAEKPGFDWYSAIGSALLSLGGNQHGAEEFRAIKKAKAEAPLLAARQQAETAAIAAAEADRQEQRRIARDRIDPNSDESRQARAQYMTQLAAYGEIPGMEKTPGLVGALKDAAANAQTMSAARIDSSHARIKDLMGLLLKGADIQAKAGNRAEDIDLKKQLIAATANDRATGRELQREGMDAAAQERELRRQERQDEHEKPPVSELDKHMARKTSLDEIDEIEKLLPKVRYTGAGAPALNSIASALPDALDPRNDAERQVSALLGRLRAPERQKLVGSALSKYDIKDTNAFMANLGNNPAQLRANLQILKKALADSSATATAAYPGLKKIDEKINRASAAVPDVNAEAKAWLEANPNDPRAPAIRKKLGL